MNAARKIVDEVSRGGNELIDSVVEVIERDCGWHHPNEIEEDGREIIVRVEARYRWLAYEPNSTHAERGLAGRWQRMNERGAWETVPAPQDYGSQHDKGEKSRASQGEVAHARVSAFSRSLWRTVPHTCRIFGDLEKGQT